MKDSVVERLLTRLQLNPTTVLTPGVRGVRLFMAALCDLTALVTTHNTLRDEYFSHSPAINHTSEIKA